MEISGNKIYRTDATKYLGVIFDDTLSWKKHTDSLCNSLLKYFGIFNQIKHFLNKKIVRQLYFAFVYSRISYGIEVFGNASDMCISKLQVIQNKLLKLALRIDRLTPTNTLHNNMKLLKISDIHKYKVIIFVNNCVTGLCPKYFTSYFIQRENPYDLRSTGLHVPRSRTTLGSLGVYSHGAKLWNGLPDNIKTVIHQKNFKKILANFYINQYV